MCLSNLLSLAAKVCLLIYRKEYIFDGDEYVPLMYNVIMHLATIDSITTTQTLRDNLQHLSVFAATVQGNIDKINTEFNTNYSQILAQKATVNNPVGMLFDANLVENTPHAPGRLFVGFAPHKHVGEGSGVRSETKIFNLETHEFGSNPPLKETSRHFHFVTNFLAGTEVKQKNCGKCLVTFWRELEL